MSRQKKTTTEIVKATGETAVAESLTHIEDRIYVIRGNQVMLDRDLAQMYGVETRRLNEAVKRNLQRFPEDFMFQLTKEECINLMSHFATSSYGSLSDIYIDNDNLKSQFVTSSWGGIRKLPFVFTEQGIAMLSGLLNSEIAIKVNIQIMRAFISMRRLISRDINLSTRVQTIEFHQLEMNKHLLETDKRIDEVFKRIEEKDISPAQGIFYNNQIFDAHTFVCDLIRSAKKRIILIDNYVDDTVLKRLDKREAGVEATIYTDHISKTLAVDIAAHNKEYAPINVIEMKKSHDRFLIIDDDLYHFGASIKDLGKKIFAFDKFIESPNALLSRL